MSEKYLRVCQLNICRGKHPQTMKFIGDHRENFDVFLLQEVIERDHVILGQHYRNCHFVPMTQVWDGVGDVAGGQGRWTTSGVGIYSNLPMTSVGAHYYVGEYGHLEHLDDSSLARVNDTKNRVVATADVVMDGVTYRLATTHFTWVPKGDPSDFQRVDVIKMAKIVQGLDDVVFCGDFNFPRHREIYTNLLKLTDLLDMVPMDIDNTLDPELHKLQGKVKAMIDHIFTTADGYRVTEVKRTFGLSDHCALTAKILPPKWPE